MNVPKNTPSHSGIEVQRCSLSCPTGYRDLNFLDSLKNMPDYTLVEPMDSGIKKLMDDYFDVMHFQNMELFDKVFHKDCTLYSAQGGELSLRPYKIYREAVANRKSPSELGESRNDKVLMFDQISNTLAVVKPQLTMFGGLMQDYLNIVFLDGQWWIMAKMWEKVGDA